MDIEFISTAFENGELIPRKYTCDGDDASPPLVWSALPESTRKLAILCEDIDDPDGPKTHWIIFDLPVSLRGLRDGIPQQQFLEDGVSQGVNDFHRVGYTGPCSSKTVHRYQFTLYALDAELSMEEYTATKDLLLKEMKGHILDQGQLVGLY
ncbi:MAG: YbhB/YbcL family Raf kinase inhibitor-like protein [Candidatus Margulisiibacteriota bacterium]|nr:MAG: hypothetical protein A2X43_12010 [Candidatus Margulisbacteria bacterium GWD2_39_127]OGI03180.1 MAG: hypothetical protein A2X42_11250 [Candidatus Margulisbacteria bacterium GWF2_38_17]PZM79478.1 MAG: YbhB/YbcL family Raf kinase inhibitor-like protein [Candidatus Margulisiibacteriota bacterium]HAR63852.1 YbhB/YbcL family Raf kinase inhibitor-like protein [Candidatus Margulisiibacteriota bacterium]HCY36091.1 YbhB/YbcL family Raf kinase inhibitor-like protein [Candidatus Margulisiibacteriot